MGIGGLVSSFPCPPYPSHETALGLLQVRGRFRLWVKDGAPRGVVRKPNYFSTRRSEGFSIGYAARLDSVCHLTHQRFLSVSVRFNPFRMPPWVALPSTTGFSGSYPVPSALCGFPPPTKGGEGIRR